MTPDDKTLGNELITFALDRVDNPTNAAGALMSAAATILERSFGQARALDMMTMALDVTGAELRARSAN